MAFKLLLTESRSALSRALCRGLEDHPFTVVGPSVDNFDWRDAKALDQLLDEHHPSVLINTLAFGGAEAGCSLALAQACAARSIVSLHISSYRVFGSASSDESGYDEFATPSPDNTIGQQLLAAEEAFLSLERSLILRLPWLLDPQGDNIFTRICSRLLSGEPLQVSDTCRSCPTTLDDAQRIIIAILLQVFCDAENWGVFHLRSMDSCSEAELADAIAQQLEKDGQTVGAIDILRNPESPLADGCGLLTGSRCTNNFGIQLRSWQRDLEGLVREWYKL